MGTSSPIIVCKLSAPRRATYNAICISIIAKQKNFSTLIFSFPISCWVGFGAFLVLCHQRQTTHCLRVQVEKCSVFVYGASDLGNCSVFWHDIVWWKRSGDYTKKFSLCISDQILKIIVCITLQFSGCGFGSKAPEKLHRAFCIVEMFIQ